MSATINLNDILSKVRELNKEEQFTLLERLIALIRRSDTTSPPVKLSKISGIGSKVWGKMNIDEFIDQERQW